MPREDDVVITGVGIVSSIGIGPEAYFQGLLEGRSGVRSLGDRTDGDASPAEGEPIDGLWIGAPVVDFEPKQYVRPRKALKVMCREIQMGFASAHLAIEHAGLSDSIPASDDGGLRPERLGTVYGGEIYFSPPHELTETIKQCMDDNGNVVTGRLGDAARREIMPLWMLKYLPNMPACQVGISINARGPNNSLVLGDVSGPAALLEAESYLQRGLADAVLVGATGTRISATRLNYRHDAPIPHLSDGKIEDASRPHDPQSSGVVGGEGAVSVVAETLSNAEQRGATVLAKVLATASRFVPTDAMRTGQRSAEIDPTPDRRATRAIQAAIESVLQRSNVAPESIGLVVSHAVGDRQVDSGEAQAVQAAGIDCPVVAVAASLGHLGAASGMAEIATGVLALAHQTVPPTRFQQVSEGVRLCQQPQPLESPYVLCLSHTTEGSAMAVLLGR
ncbi:3-oxoacyl-ACP synthase [Roseiconus nitratireducens]|uniref:3-oxoacyl-ACP synthase n=1 Tax=Roseiconus nitratireducens TaxID=2605748 RepID=A0A5M6DCH4_9BACT|nr:beta-ketoacyl synthase N-terminal-like domain-containing protein [Roseiconus nitratireducens]KAA5545261.1 3-oxoacyl-ACP synthase [Roseiconus nitratireducens]